MTIVLDQPHQIASFRDSIMLMHVKARAQGRHLTRPSAAPTLKRIRAEYGIKAKTWAQAEIELATLLGK